MESDVQQAPGAAGVDPAALRRQCEALGLRLVDVARLTALGADVVAAVEAGAPAPTGPAAQRLAAFVALPWQTSFASTDYLTLARLADHLSALPSDPPATPADAEGATGPDALRLVIQASDDFAALALEADRRFFLAEPCAAIDPRVDALVAALAVHLCRAAGMATTPGWTRHPTRYLPSFWRFPAAAGTLEAFKYQRTPSCFRARGIIFNADNLVSV